MKFDRGHWVIAGATVLIIAYVLLYAPVATWIGERAEASAEAAQAAAQAQEGASMSTQGSLATGTLLKRRNAAGEYVLVAELWALNAVDARDAEVVNFTSHDSAYRYEEVEQCLRELRRVEILGHHLPEQTQTWISDFNAGGIQRYSLTYPDGSTTYFHGWVQTVRASGELAGALVFRAIIYPTYYITEYWHCIGDAPIGEPPVEGEYWEEAEMPPGITAWQCIDDVTAADLPGVPPPLDSVHWTSWVPPTSDYWHCTDAPAAPGTPPPDDLENWEPVDPPDGLEGGDAVFGSDVAGGSWWSPFDLEALGTTFPFPSGTAGNSWQVNINTTGDWPASITSYADLWDPCAIHCIYDAETNAPASIRALVKGTQGSGWAQTRAAIYTTGGALVVGSDWVPLVTGEQWYDYSLTSAPALTEGVSYVLLVEANWSIMYDMIEVSKGGTYTPPDGGAWDPDDDYEYCQTVRYDPEYDILSWSPTAVYDLADIVSYEPIWLEWDDSTQYKWCNFVHYRPD